MRCLLLVPSLASLAFAAPALARDGFLDDGGGIRTERIVGTPYGPAVIDVPALGEGRPFLEDGGGIRFAPELPRYRNGSAASGQGGEYQISPSVTALPDASAQSVSSSGGVSVVVINGSGTPHSVRAHNTQLAYGGPKIIHVASARLDRRPFDGSGVDVVRSGATKIIRIAPGWRGATANEDLDTPATDETLELENGSDRASTQTPDMSNAVEADQPSTSLTQNGTSSRNETGSAESARTGPVPGSSAVAESGTDLEPWTEAWRADCVRRHADFDPSLGTYRDETGRRRFCTGDL